MTAKISLHIAVLGIVLSAGALFFESTPIWLGTVLGAALAFMNWLVISWVGVRLTNDNAGTLPGVLFSLKTFLLMGAVAVVYFVVRPHDMAFMLGLSVLPAGLISAALASLSEMGEPPTDLKEERENA